MNNFDISELRESSVLYLYSIKSEIKLNPDYQRVGEIWTTDKRQLLIDSLFNGFDIPKIYLHELDRTKAKTDQHYAVIDGRQRLETIWGFIDGKFALSEGFEYLKNPKIKMTGLTYREVANTYPLIKAKFDALSLSVFVVRTDDIDLIEEMFSRLNEAVPLNAAEKRNAFGGPLPKIIRNLASHELFADRVAIPNKRYQHRDIAAKLLYLIHFDEILDTKKIYLDEFVKKNKTSKESVFTKSIRRANKTMDVMFDVFSEKDKLLRSPGMLVLYFLLFKEAIDTGETKKITRSALQRFEQARIHNREVAEENITGAKYELLEFDRLVQTPNDAFAMRERLKILKKHLKLS